MERHALKRHQLIAIGILVVGAGCARRAEPPSVVTPPGRTAEAPRATEAVVQPAVYKRNPEDPFQADLYAEPEFTAKVAPYKVAADFANVANWIQFAKSFDEEGRRRLALNGFVVVPADRKQMSFVYEENNYTSDAKAREIPSFVT